jgi:regulatory protein
LIISAIERQKTNQHRYNIYVDGEYFCALDIITVVKNHLKAGMEVEDDFLEILKGTDKTQKARDKALNYLSYSQHSKQSLTKKLKKAGFEDHYIDHAVHNLEKTGLVDDKKHALNLCDYYYKKKFYGKNRVVLELIKKGIDNDMAKQAAEDSCPDDFYDSILRLIDKKCRNKISLEKKDKESLIRFLLNYGHEFTDIKKVLNQRF